MRYFGGTGYKDKAKTEFMRELKRVERTIQSIKAKKENKDKRKNTK